MDQDPGSRTVWPVKEDQLSNQFGSLVEKIAIGTADAARIAQKFERRFNTRRSDSESLRQGIQLQIGRIRRWTEEAYTDKLEGRISEDHWKKLSQKWEADRIGLQAQLNSLDSPNSNSVIALNKILELLQALPTVWIKGNNTERRQILELVHSNFQLSGANVSATIKKPFSLFAEGLGCLNKRG